jgi:hypothetical protein
VIAIDVSGCIKNGTRLAINEKMTIGLQVFQCQRKPNGATAMCAVGCIANGREYTAGQEFQDNEYVYQCVAKPGGCVPVVVACLDENQRRVQPGLTFHRGSSVYQCLLKDGNLELRLQACVVSGNGAAERILGDTWTEGEYMWQCVEKENKAIPTQVRCIVGTRQLEPGCVVMDKDQSTGCRKLPDGGLHVEQFGADQFSLAVTYQLRMC